MSRREPLKTLLPTETFDLDSGLTLTPRVKLSLTIHRADKSVSPIDEWKLKRSLIDYLRTSHSIVVPEEDIRIFKYRDLKKRKREDPVARGSLFVLDLGFLSRKLGLSEKDGVEKEFLDWRKGIMAEMDGMELNLESVKFKLSVELPKGDDFEGMRKEWEELAAFGAKGYQRGERQKPDTIILRGVPSRWFAEPRVSSKPSMLVTHTIFSAFGKIRNLEVGEDNVRGEDENEDSGDLVSGLHCKILVQYESYEDFSNALKILSGRSLNKQGSRLRADYEVTWDRDGYFRNRRSRTEEGKRWAPLTGVGNYSTEAAQHQSRVSRTSPDNARRKRFKD
ncbi:ZCW7 [Striga hermonthica]|uniref:ZCW7 n=1 Tax=Striga hermonthica TaxID=68872 RepID=A0A9N7P189_STRHE|nr:ZCW7 [Striga hermonthica]